MLNIESACTSLSHKNDNIIITVANHLKSSLVLFSNVSAQLVSSYDSYDFEIELTKTANFSVRFIASLKASLLVLILLAVEYLVRHTFYYILLGKFNP